MSWGRESGTRPSGKAFSFRLSDAERLTLQAAVDAENKGRAYYSAHVTLGEFIKKAALAAAAATTEVKKPAKPASEIRAALELGPRIRDSGAVTGYTGQPLAKADVEECRCTRTVTANERGTGETLTVDGTNCPVHGPREALRG